MSTKRAGGPTRTVSLDELLERQVHTATLATISGVPEKKDAVKVTPWLPGAGCLCHYAIVVPKRAINELKSTSHQHVCCGKLLDVVEVTFREGRGSGNGVSVSEIFEQLIIHAGEVHDEDATYPPRVGARVRSTYGNGGFADLGIRTGDSSEFCARRCEGDPDPEQCMCFCQNMFRRIKRFC